MQRTSATRPAAGGFGLVELMVVLAIMAILTAIAWPAYQQQVRKGRRSDAMAGVAQVMQAQERWRSNNATYQSDIGLLPGASTTSQGGYYSLSIVAGTATADSYTVKAAVVSGTPQSADATCGALLVAASAGVFSYSSANSQDVANGSPDPCWVK